MIKRLKETWDDLGRSIFEGERYERNMHGIMIAAVVIICVNMLTGIINQINGYENAAKASFLYIVSGLLILYFVRSKKNRNGAIITGLVATVILFTFEIITVEHGFPIYWTLLIPFAFCYFASVRTGLLIAVYFLILYFMLFMTPMRNILACQYPDTIVQRFPVLYLADMVLTAFIMVQYHRTTLRQMDNAKQLIEAKEEADKANAAKSDFLANMSHEIRTPINAVLGMNEMILRESSRFKGQAAVDPAAAAKAFREIDTYAEDLGRAGDDLLSIINEILDFTKIEADRIELADAPYRLSALLSDVAGMVSYKAKEKGLEFTVEAAEDLPEVLRGDEARLRQIMLNLLDNAVKYTHEGGVTLSVRREGEEELKEGGDIRLVIAVSDSGIGISEEDIGRLFNRFERVDMKKNSTIEGAGLGLAIVKRLAEMMGGGISVESVYGEGSTFTAVVTQKVMSADQLGEFAAEAAKRSEGAGTAASFRAPDAHILIVDDTKINLTVAAGLLKGTDINIDTAGSGAEALIIAEGEPYDLILMDQRMPEMDGTEAMRKIKEASGGANRGTPFICLTADAIIGAREHYLEEGFSDYLAKPVDARSLEQILLKYLPEEKIIPVKAGETGSAYMQEQEGDDSFAPLRGAGISIETGLKYCQGDEDLYRSLLRDYTQDAEEKRRDMALFYEARDWKSYSILVHALKSSSAMIGATGLSLTAAAMERAADEGREKDIAGGHEAMLAAYGAAVRAILQAQESGDGREADAANAEDDEILEFLPEEYTAGE